MLYSTILYSTIVYYVLLSSELFELMRLVVVLVARRNYGWAY